MYSLACFYTDNWKATLLEHSVKFALCRILFLLLTSLHSWLKSGPFLGSEHTLPIPGTFSRSPLSWSCLSTGHSCPCPAFYTRCFWHSGSSPNMQLVRGVGISRCVREHQLLCYTHAKTHVVADCWQLCSMSQDTACLCLYASMDLESDPSKRGQHLASLCVQHQSQCCHLDKQWTKSLFASPWNPVA